MMVDDNIGGRTLEAFQTAVFPRSSRWNGTSNDKGTK